MSLTGRFGALEERPFRLLWIGQSLSAAGDALIPVALAFAVLGLSGSAADLGLVLAVFTLARVVFTLAGGVWADRLSRRRVMLIADLLRAAAQTFLAVVFIADVARLWQVVVAAAVVGAAAAFFGPASTGLIPETVSRHRLQEANALIGLSQNACFIFGPVLSGLLVAAFGPGWVFGIDAVSFLASAGFLFAMRVPEVARAARQSFLADLAGGWREVKGRSWLWGAFITFSLSNLSIAAFFVLGPLVASSELDGARDWGVILMGGAIGGLAGSAVALRYRPARPLIPSFLLILPASLQLVSLVHPAPLLVIAVAGGMTTAGIAIANALWDTVLQQNIPRDAISRVSSYDWMISLVFMPIGYALAGPVSERIGVDATLWAAAGLCVTANLGVLAVPSIRHMRRRDALGDEEARVPAIELPA